MNFRVGDKVTWTSQANGISKTKNGVVVQVVPANQPPSKKVRGTHEYNCRDHESYLVSTPERTYWPRVSQLKLVPTQMELVKES